MESHAGSLFFWPSIQLDTAYHYFIDSYHVIISRVDEDPKIYLVIRIAGSTTKRGGNGFGPAVQLPLIEEQRKERFHEKIGL